MGPSPELGDVVDHLGRAHGVEASLEPHRLGVQRLFEDRARITRVSEPLPALRPLEDPAQLGLGVLGEEVLVLGREAMRDRDELVVRVVGEDELAREP